MRVLAALAMMMASLIAVPAQAQKSEAPPKFTSPAKAAQVLEDNVTGRATPPPVTDKVNGSPTLISLVACGCPVIATTASEPAATLNVWLPAVRRAS